MNKLYAASERAEGSARCPEIPGKPLSDAVLRISGHDGFEREFMTDDRLHAVDLGDLILELLQPPGVRQLHPAGRHQIEETSGGGHSPSGLSLRSRHLLRKGAGRG